MDKIEIWKDIIGYVGLYIVSNYGRIKSFKREGNLGGILNPTKNKDGYFRISLSKNNIIKKYMIHRLVLESFVGPCPKEMQCCHNDGNPANNFVGNLRWDTPP